MRPEAPFQRDDLAELESLLAQADRVVGMAAVAAGDASPRVIGLRHDVDNFIEPAVAMAEWEAEHGYTASYFILHTAPYWQDKRLLEDSLDRIAGCGHEIGFHVNAITEAIETGRDPVEIIADATAELRGYGYPVTGVVAHGDQACYRHHFVNDEVFLESLRPDYGPSLRTVGGVKLSPVSRSRFGFDYDPNWLPRGEYLSDSGGRWSQPFDRIAARFPSDGQLHMLVHPDWWGQAFALEEAAA